MHETYPVTVAVCTGVAALIPGTVVQEIAKEKPKQTRLVRMGHPAGVISAKVDIRKEGDNIIVEKATVGRTARKLMDGFACVKEA